jgi:hypothetical protein
MEPASRTPRRGPRKGLREPSQAKSENAAQPLQSVDVRLHPHLAGGRPRSGLEIIAAVQSAPGSAFPLFSLILWQRPIEER